MPRRMLTGPAADGTVRCRSLIRTSGVSSWLKAESAEWHPSASYIVALAWRRKGWYVIAMVLAVAAPAQWPLRRGCWCLGDSLTAGYGLPHADGFEMQLQQALEAARACGHHH